MGSHNAPKNDHRLWVTPVTTLKKHLTHAVMLQSDAALSSYRKFWIAPAKWSQSLIEHLYNMPNNICCPLRRPRHILGNTDDVIIKAVVMSFNHDIANTLPIHRLSRRGRRFYSVSTAPHAYNRYKHDSGRFSPIRPNLATVQAEVRTQSGALTLP